jgi:hypothetical protein
VVLTGNRCSRRHRMLLERLNIDEALIAFRRAASLSRRCTGSGLGCERFASSLATGLTALYGSCDGVPLREREEPVTKLDPLVAKPRDTEEGFRCAKRCSRHSGNAASSG